METHIKTKKLTLFLKKRLTASAAIITTFTGLMVLTVCLIWFTMTQALGSYLNQQTEVLGSSLATQAAFNATQSILTNDLLSLNVLLNRLVVDDNILSARVYNKKDELLAEADSGNSDVSKNIDLRPSDKHRLYSSSIRFRDEVVGHVLITLDRTPTQSTLKHLSNLLIGVSIFICAIALLLVILLARWLFSPINDATDALKALAKGHKDTPLPSPSFKEGRKLCQAIQSVQTLDWPIKEEPVTIKPESLEPASKTQLEMDFDKIFEESNKRSCLLYFDILNINDWHEEMTQLQVANLLTPIYRAMFQASETFMGQVHQYNNDSVVIFFSASTSKDNLYLNAISTGQLFLGLMEELLNNELYQDTPTLNFHLGLHKGGPEITEMMATNTFDRQAIQPLLNQVEQLSHSQSVNKLVLSDSIFMLNDIQHRVFTGLPEVIDIDGDEVLAYEVKGMAEKLQEKVKQKRFEIQQHQLE
ncbi:AhpA/YtjB family protein [Marinomonas pollencensis]|uniref:Putative membrane protein affecting hemolysin expression n=1 Tax=Marinomonas pollencensis TaxID=491954 RepID=A0A3E0DTY8_9GAMM|nr:AhpA/YtjB family protein [Marinomonas pollencensis]REG86856.1 putative membrane protein affecting hemolysin expression [Marinomonas pollencensis]